jgi:DNA-binding NarL/FixJ family response regulator
MQLEEERKDPPIRIGLLDFEPIRVAGFRSIFDEGSRVEVVATDLQGALANRTLDMVLFGLQDPLASFEVLAKLKSQRPRLKLIVMGDNRDDETIINAIAAGAKGYLEETASPELVMQAIDVVQSGSIWAPRRVLSIFVDRMLNSSARPVRRHNMRFTLREREVLKLLVAAHSNREIARSLGIEERTVKAYIARLMRKVGVENRIALSIHAASRELASPEDN